MSCQLDTNEIIARSHFTGVELQITDIALAHSFLNHAETSRDPQVIAHSRHKAREAYDSILRFLASLNATAEQQSRIDARLPELKARLEAAQG